MPQLDFFVARDDGARLVRKILDLGCTMVVGRQYETAKYETITTSIEYFRLRDRGETLFFVVSSVYTRSPLVVERIEEGPNYGKYFIKQRNGGPTIDLFCPQSYVKDNLTHLPSGMLGYYPTFWNTLSNRNEKTPPELRRVFSALAKEVRSGALKISTGKRSYWVAPGVLDLLKAGTKLVGIREELIQSVTGRGGKVS